jgi:hypothetical protein
MKTSDLQQMQQQYRLIAENNDKSNYDDLIEKYSSINYKIQKLIYSFTNATYELRQLMTSDKFAFAANTDWIGTAAAESRKRGGPPLPPTYDEWVERNIQEIQLCLDPNYVGEE